MGIIAVVARRGRWFNRVTRTAARRIEELWATMDIEGAEVLSIAAALCCAFVLVMPGDFLRSNPALGGLLRYASEGTYTFVLFVLGFYQAVACALGGIPSEMISGPRPQKARTWWYWARLRGLRYGVPIWLMLCVLMYQGGGYFAMVFFGLIGAASFWGSNRIAKLIKHDVVAEEVRRYREMDVKGLEVEPVKPALLP